MAEDEGKPLPAADKPGSTTSEPVLLGEAPSTDPTKHEEATVAAAGEGAEAVPQHCAEPTLAEKQGLSAEEIQGVQQDPAPEQLRHDPGNTTTTSRAAASSTARGAARIPTATTRSRQEPKTKDRQDAPSSNEATSVLQQGADSSGTAASPTQQRGITENGVSATPPGKEEWQQQQQQQRRHSDSLPSTGARQQSPRSVEVPEVSGGSVPVVVPESSEAKRPPASPSLRAPPGPKGEERTGQSQPTKGPLKGRASSKRELGPNPGGAVTEVVAGSVGGGAPSSQQSNGDPAGPEHDKNTAESRHEHESGWGGQGKEGTEIKHAGKEKREGKEKRGKEEGRGAAGHESSEKKQRKDQEANQNEGDGQSVVVAEGGEEESEIHRSASTPENGSQPPPAVAPVAAALTPKNTGDIPRTAQQQPRAMPKWEERSSRPTVRASMHVIRSPPLTSEALSQAKTPATNMVYTTTQGASVVGGAREGEWKAFAESQQTRRRHSAPDLVPRRRHSFNPRLSQELFEEPSSDNDSPRAASDGANPDDNSEDQVPEKVAPWELSAEGKSRIATLKKATVQTSAKMMTRKYLKLFVPMNSARDTYQVLAALHRRMNGIGWPRRGGWGSYLIRKSQAELDEGRVYGVKSQSGSVELLMLSSNNVRGRIPAMIARLGSLKSINFSDNHISGPIPAELGLLLQLQTLQLQGNNLRDGISPLLGSLISLVRLSLGHNKLTGPLPDSLGNLINLQFLSVEHNRLTGHIPIIICRLFILETFNASNNQLEGTIPTGIGGLEKLKRLDLGHNRLTGEIPVGVCTLKFLSWLRLDNNQLTGPVPEQVGDLKNLIILNLSSNQLSGRVPRSLASLSDLISGDLRGNLLEGGLPFPTDPAVASDMVGLRTLDLGFNELDEPFPGLRGLVQLRTLALDNNRVYGELGEGLANGCPNLFKLHLQNNKLSGQIPLCLGILSKLQHLDLSDNSFHGSLPQSLETLRLLRTLSASNNELSGDLPAFLGSLTLLTYLALNGNKFRGSIPPELGKLVGLERLYLENNELEGPIPPELATCISLEELYLHCNKLCGDIPDSLRSLRGLRYLYLHQNRFTGMIPDWLGELSQLRGLVLGENRFRGTIPWQLGHLHKLEDLYLNDNDLEGNIPERVVVNCEGLQRLYLGGNRLTGRVPRHLRHVRDLRELNLERNNLHGELPIPLFLKTSLGPNARGLKFGGNPRIVDSREHFVSTVTGIRRPVLRAASSMARSFALLERQQSIASKRSPVPATIRVPGGGDKPPRLTSTLTSGDGGGGASGSFQGSFRGSFARTGSEGTAGAAAGGRKYIAQRQAYLDLEIGAAAAQDDDAHSEYGNDRDSPGQPWVTSEDVCYFLFKVAVGNALIVLDFVVAISLFNIGCVWGSLVVLVGRAMAALEGVLTTRDLGYGGAWLSLAAVGLALPLQARRCYHHSCESDLFQALQHVEWRWHAMIQMGTQMAAALSCWDKGPLGLYLWLSVGLKALVVGVVSMQRLDDRRLLRAQEKMLASPSSSAFAPVTLASVLQSKVAPCLGGSAWPRLILVGFHVAEVGERTVPFASLAAALGGWAFLAPFAMVPGMVVRYVARRKRNTLRSDGVVSTVQSIFGVSLALDSSFGSGTREHLFAAIATTVETIAFNSIASNTPREYSNAFGDALISACSVMLVYTWVVLVLEALFPMGREPPRLLPPPAPRLALPDFVDAKAPKINVQPVPFAESGSGIGGGAVSAFSSAQPFVNRRSGQGKETASVVPTEGIVDNESAG